MQRTLPIGKKPFSGNLFSTHYLENKLPSGAHWKDIGEKNNKVYEEIKELYKNKADFLEKLDESPLEDEFIKPILKILGHIRDVQSPILTSVGMENKPDYTFFESEEAKRKAIDLRNARRSEEYYKLSIGIGEAKHWNVDLDRGRQENPSVKMSKYLRLSLVPWGILTNGRYWRIYSREVGFSSNLYYEVNLPSLLEHGTQEDFKYFYGFFSHQAFVKEEGQCFLDRVFNESIKFAKRLEEDLRENVYKCLKIIAKGFLESNNNLPPTKENIKEIHKNTLILLYRFLFIFYAEARDLLPLENILYKSYSIQKLREEIARKVDKNEPFVLGDIYWRKLRLLFKLLNIGAKELGVSYKQLPIPPYNGGLFKPEEYSFLEKYNINDKYLAEAIDLLSRRSGEGGRGYVDYSTLSIRHLGSIYEGLLEYKLKIAEEDLVEDKEKGKDVYRKAENGEKPDVHKNELYLVTDKGERKATGSYYTPDYIVKYIVENTLEPIIEEKAKKVRNNGDLLDELLSIKVLDPAMGSGHFLVEATNFLANKVIEKLEEADYRDIPDLSDVKRTVAERCIYGVDLNPLATELAKVSLWLETVASDKPLSFLDHHLQCGNSLIGAHFEDLAMAKDKSQVTIFSNTFNTTARQMIKKRMQIEKLSSDTIENVEEKEKLLKEVTQLRQRFREVLDIHTSKYFENDVPDNEFYNFIMSIGADEKTWNEFRSKEWFKNALKISEEKRFFNWEIRFPEIFFDEYGSVKDNPGFDVVVGNPPYIDSEEMTRSLPEEREYCVNRKYNAASGNWDIFCIFIEQGISLVGHGGFFGYIVPNKLLAAEYALETQNIIKKYALRKLRDYSRVKVFEINVYPIIPIVQKSAPQNNHIMQVQVMEEVETPELPIASFENIVRLETFSKLPEGLWSPLVRENFPIVQKVLNVSDPITKYGDVVGAATVSEAYELQNVLEDITVPPQEEYSKFINTGTIDRYSSLWGNVATTYIKKQYIRPVVRHRNLCKISEKRLNQAKSRKVIIGGMTQRLEAFYDYGIYVAGKSTVLVLPRKSNLKFLTSCINSKLISFVYRELFESLSLQGGYLRIGPPQIKRIPIRRINFTTLEKERQKLVSELKDLYADGGIVKIISTIDSHLPKDEDGNFIKEKEKSDVVHDLLVFLTDQMIDMKKQEHKLENALDLFKYLPTDIPVNKFSKLFKEEIKYARTLEDADILNEPHEINDLWLDKEGDEWILEVELKLRDTEKPKNFLKEGNKIKKEWYKIYAFDIDDKKAEYYQAIFENLYDFENAKIPGGYKKKAKEKLFESKLPVFDDDKLKAIKPYLEIWEELLELRDKIDKTDWLIDQIVYKLYGLTDEEIKIVEEAVGGNAAS
jgi:hypothetical protein